MTAFEISTAYMADLIFGDPPGYPHPVKLIGRAIHFLEKKWLRWADSPFEQRLMGGVLAVLIVAGTATLTWAIIRTAEWIHPAFSFIATIFFAYTTLATRNLYDEVKKVIHFLEEGDLIRARKEVGFLVSRDTDHLNEGEIDRALIETISENTSDGIVAPLFYLLIGGPPLAMAYKALNTLDSMVGYKNDRYRYFGWASAKADDLANFIPARMTAFLFILSSLILRKDWENAWKVAWRDGPKNLSPNSGYPEAAVAGALGIQLGGKNFYFGKRQNKPLIGHQKKSISMKEVEESLHLMMTTSIIAGMATILFTLFIE
ncbi:MAG: cobalamin biosynthesis protein CobD [Deltaproteobacteria bacterium]|nr:cobalamin biosynthesis protein CobD [Deltaproteobacteria bacterium]